MSPTPSSDQPMVTLAVRPSDVRLGDVAETRGGTFVVREIVQRLSRPWLLAGDPPGHRRPWSTTDPAPLLSRAVGEHVTIRVRRSADRVGRLTGHARQVASYQPRTSGCYTLVDEWTAACGCGWTAEKRLARRSLAERAWLEHKADQVTARAVDQQPGLAAVAALEAAAHGELPVLPWFFARGGAEVDLSDWPLAEARAAVTAWGAALEAVDGLTELDPGTERETGIPGHRHGAYLLGAYGRAADTWVHVVATIPAEETVPVVGGVL